MSNANPTTTINKPANWYGPKTESPGLTPTKTLTPVEATAKESIRCECGTKVWLLNGADSAPCSCGKVLKKK